MKLFYISFLLTLVFITTKLQGAMAIDPETNFNQLVDQYFDEYFKHNPTAATAAGFHQRDAELEDYSQTEVRAQVAMLKGFASKFENIRAKSLRPETASDRELVISNINAALLDLEHVRSWEKNPDRYNSGVANSAYTIMSRSFAPADERLRSLISRERQMPKVFEAARANLRIRPAFSPKWRWNRFRGRSVFSRMMCRRRLRRSRMKNCWPSSRRRIRTSLTRSAGTRSS